MSRILKLFLYYIVLPLFCLAPIPFAYAQPPSAPVAVNVSNFLIQNIAGRSQILPLIGSDADGTITSFKILSLPNASAGTLYLNNIPVTINQSLIPSDAQKLQFEVLSTFTNGTVSFTYTVTDNSNLTDTTPATFTIPVTNNGALLVCTGGGLGTNILGASGTFSAPYITAATVVSCINDGHNIAAPIGNLGNVVAGLTSYNYASTSNSLGPEGTYSFLKTMGTMATRNCIKTDWVASDHTGDGGYAMIVNGSPNAATFGKTFYQASSLTVCPNTLYEFSAYVINVLPGNSSFAVAGSEPNISFYINNQLVSTSGAIAYATGPSYTPQWVKVGGLWYSGPNTSVNLRIDNATLVAGGNDLGLDDISLAICGPEISYPNISLTPKFCSYGVLPLNAEVKASINTYSSYIFQQSIDGGTTWTDMGTPKSGSPVYDSGTNSYVFTATYGNIPIDPSMNGYRYRLKVATNSANLTGTTCNISADKVITVSAFTKPAGGADIVSCTPISGAALAAAQAGETWSVSASNPAAAAISQGGQVTGLTVNGIYEFYLTNAAGCIDTVKITRSEVKSAGTDAVVCSSESSFKFADAPAGYQWKIVSGNPSAAAIDPATGYVSNLGIDGDYQFELVSMIAPCADVVKLTKGVCPNVNFRAATSSFPEKAGTVTIEVFLDQVSTLPVTTPYSLGVGSASNTTDFTTVTGNLEFNAGETSKLITVNLIDDALIEPDETAVFNLGTPINASLGTVSQHILTILNDDAAICITPENTVHNEGQPLGGPGTSYTFKVSRSPGSYTGDAITFSYRLGAVTAEFAANDLLDGTDLNKVIQGTIPAGQNEITLSYSVKTDLLIEGDETFKVELINADTGVTINCTEAQGIVLNDDLNKTIIQFEKIATSTPEGNINVILKVILSNPAPQAIDVSFDLTDITATNDLDYEDIPAVSRKVQFNIGDTEAFIMIAIKEDNFDEPDESFKATLLDPGDSQFVLGSQDVHTITIMDDDPIIVADDNFSTNEDTPLSNTVKTNDYDPGGDPLTFTLLTTPQHGQVQFNANGTFTYTPDQNYSGNDSFTYRACNINNLPSCGDATVSIIVVPVNDIPIAVDDNFSGTEDTNITGAVDPNDSDPDGDLLTFTRLTNPVNGTLIFNANGTFTYSPGHDFSGTDSFTYRACDPSGSCAVASVTLTITSVNDPPVAVKDNFTTSECNTLTGSVAVNDTDPDNTPSELVYSISGSYDTSIGTITIQPDGTFTFTPAGRFSGSLQVQYRVTDPAGLFATGLLTITQPNPLLLLSLASKSDLKCSGDNSGAISLAVSGGLAPYSFAWSNGASTSSLTALAAGTYTATVTDANGCTANISVTITEPPLLTVSETHQNNACFDASTGSINLSISGGKAPYTYLWSNGATTQNLSGLPPGSYNVIVTDANGCSANASVTITEPPPLTVSDTHQNNTCFGTSTGSINLVISGGTAPYTYLWSNGATIQNLSGLPPGSYNVIVTDANGCSANASVTITEPPLLTISETHQNNTCYGASTGSINLALSGGTAPYTYLWSNGAATQTLSALTSGSYNVVVTDANGCSTNLSVTITQPTLLTVSETHQNNTCFGASTGNINLAVSGGTAPYTYLWSNGAATQNLSALASGSYNVVVTDANGCSTNLSITITEPPLLTVSETHQNSTCFGASNGKINLVTTGGTSPYTYSWSNGSASQNLSALVSGTYTAVVTDANGCTASATIIINQPAALKINETHQDIKCYGSSDGSVTLTVSGGTSPYSYTWSNGANTQNLINLSSGTYKVIVTDAGGCSVQEEVKITQPAAMTGVLKASNTICKNSNDGKITMTVTGGVAPYSFTWNNNPYLNTQNLTGAAGKYKVVITDKNNCSIELSTEILPGNCPPTAINDEFNAPENTEIINSVAPNDNDPDQDKLVFTNKSNPQHGTFVFNSDGSFSFKPDPSWSGTASFNYTACDASGLCSSATVTLLISKVNRPPVAINDTYQTPIGVPLIIKANGILGNDYDPDNDPITSILQSQPLHARVELKQDGSFIYTPEKTFQGEDNFTYFANDGVLNSNLARVTINIPGNSASGIITTVNLTPARNQIAEGDTAIVTAILTNDLPEDVTLTLSFSGTATNTTKFEGNDYKLSGDYVKMRIPAGQIKTTEKFNIEALPDNLKEGDEFVNARISSVSTPNAIIGSDALVVIKDIYPPVAIVKNEPPPNPDILPDPYVSPNGDGKGNETFIISNINLYPDNEVVIFNRWGNEVFRIQSYNNTNNVFKGKANRGLMTNTAADLPEGVYYFLIYSRTVLKEPRLNKGYIILKR